MAYQMASIIMTWSDPEGHFSCLKPLKPPTPREIYHVLATICDIYILPDKRKAYVARNFNCNIKTEDISR